MPDHKSTDRDEQPQRTLDPEEFVGLILAYDARIRGFISSLMISWKDVDDVMQNSCMAAYRKLKSFSYEGSHPDEAFVRWVCTIAKYEVLMYYRRKQSDRVTFSSEVIEELAKLQLEHSEKFQDRIDALSVCIEQLGDDEKSLIQMRYWHGISVAQIGDRIGRTANGVYKALERVRAKLMSCIRLRLKAEGS